MRDLIYLARHAEPDYPDGKPVFLGQHIDLSLNKHGRIQAVKAAEALMSEPVCAVYSSPLRRALETACPYAEATGQEICILPELSELDTGLWEGMTMKEVRAKWPGHFDGDHLPPPGGESDEEGLKRALAMLDMVRTDGNGPAVLFSHNGLLRLLLSRLMGVSPLKKRLIPLEHAAIYRVHFQNGLLPEVTLFFDPGQ